MDVLKLRPHHINCLFFYEGKGYNKYFIENMNAITEQLKTDSKQLIMLERSSDRLCKACPHLKDSLCISNEKIDLLDRKTLQAYNLKENTIYQFSEIIDTLYSQFRYEVFSKICSTCEWYKQGVCAKEKIERQKAAWSRK